MDKEKGSLLNRKSKAASLEREKVQLFVSASLTRSSPGYGRTSKHHSEIELTRGELGTSPPLLGTIIHPCFFWKKVFSDEKSFSGIDVQSVLSAALSNSKQGT